jgi:hypothetical protein
LWWFWPYGCGSHQWWTCDCPWQYFWMSQTCLLFCDNSDKDMNLNFYGNHNTGASKRNPLAKGFPPVRHHHIHIHNLNSNCHLPAPPQRTVMTMYGPM